LPEGFVDEHDFIGKINDSALLKAIVDEPKVLIDKLKVQIKDGYLHITCVIPELPRKFKESFEMF
jgi:hypothetical protein